MRRFITFPVAEGRLLPPWLPNFLDFTGGLHSTPGGLGLGRPPPRSPRMIFRFPDLGTKQDITYNHLKPTIASDSEEKRGNY